MAVPRFESLQYPRLKSTKLISGRPARFRGEPNRRATGFGAVMQHDGIVPAQGVGGPVVDSSGRVVGLNIARADRMKTYALPAARVRASLDAMLARIAAGDVLP